MRPALPPRTQTRRRCFSAGEASRLVAPVATAGPPRCYFPAWCICLGTPALGASARLGGAAFSPNAARGAHHAEPTSLSAAGTARARCAMRFPLALRPSHAGLPAPPSPPARSEHNPGEAVLSANWHHYRAVDAGGDKARRSVPAFHSSHSQLRSAPQRVLRNPPHASPATLPTAGRGARRPLHLRLALLKTLPGLDPGPWRAPAELGRRRRRRRRSRRAARAPQRPPRRCIAV